jgi:hypothetical protein
MRRQQRPQDFAATLAFVGVLITIVASAYLISAYRRRKRTESLQKIAEELGLEFAPGADGNLVFQLANFELFSKGKSSKATNLLQGQSGDRALAIFDYEFTTGSGKSRHTTHTTVLKIRFDGPELPDFSLRPRNIWDKIGSLLGRKGIELESNPKFSRAYMLRGENEPEVRALFSSAVLDFYELHPELTTEASGNTLLLYRRGQRTSPTQFGNFLSEGLELLPILTQT